MRSRIYSGFPAAAASRAPSGAGPVYRRPNGARAAARAPCLRRRGGHSDRAANTVSPQTPPKYLSHISKDDDAAARPAFLKIGKCLRCLIDRIGPSNEFVELQSTAAIKTNEPRKIQLRSRRTIIAAGQRFFGDRDVLRIQNDLVGGRGNTDGHGRPAAAQDTEGLLGNPTESHAIEGIIGTTASELVQGFADLVLSGHIEGVGSPEALGQFELGGARVDRDDHRGARNRAALDRIEADPAA